MSFPGEGSLLSCQNYNFQNSGNDLLKSIQNLKVDFSQRKNGKNVATSVQYRQFLRLALNLHCADILIILDTNLESLFSNCDHTTGPKPVDCDSFAPQEDKVETFQGMITLMSQV